MKIFNFINRLKAIREEKRCYKFISGPTIELGGETLFPKKVARAKEFLKNLKEPLSL